MERLVKGDVVVLPFPFSDLSQSKKRPAFVVAPLQGDDVILCQITTVVHSDLYSILLEEKDFVTGSLLYSRGLLYNLKRITRHPWIKYVLLLEMECGCWSLLSRKLVSIGILQCRPRFLLSLPTTCQ